MPTNPLTTGYKSVVKNKSLTGPWKLLPKHTVYDNAVHHHPARGNTMPSRVTLYNPVLKAIWMYANMEAANAMPVRLVKQSAITSQGTTTRYAAEFGLQDDSSLVITVMGKSIRISHCVVDTANESFESDPLLPFTSESDDTIAAIFLAALPAILETDTLLYGGKLNSAVQEIGNITGASSWQDKNDIPEIVQNAFYYTDIALQIFMDLEFEFGPATSSVAEEVDNALLNPFTTASPLTGSIIVEDLAGWTPKFVAGNGVAAPIARKNMTIGEAKAMFSGYFAHRKWTPAEQMMIPHFQDNMPVMEETIWIAEAITKTRDGVNPIVNGMWRGVTSYGKSTGIKQLAAILNMPLLIITCHPNMEISEFKSTYVPYSGDESIELDMSAVSMPAKAETTTVVVLPFFADAINHIKSMSDSARKEIMDTASFISLACMDSETACESLLGRVEDIPLEELLNLYYAVVSERGKAPLLEKIARLEAAGNKEEKDDSAPQFVHVISNYAKALVNGYIVEIQEASRIRDSGVLVGLNEFDRPGATISLMNGGLARRHKDAICIITDNVGYTSCRPIDPSVLRRQGFIIDSYELTREQVIDRVKLNTGCTDTGLLDLGYTLWDTVKSHCEHHSIVEGSVSPTELERFVQAVMFGGPDSITRNLNNCIISKATSSIEDQREIREACAALCPAITV